MTRPNIKGQHIDLKGKQKQKVLPKKNIEIQDITRPKAKQGTATPEFRD